MSSDLATKIIGVFEKIISIALEIPLKIYSYIPDWVKFVAGIILLLGAIFFLVDRKSVV